MNDAPTPSDELQSGQMHTLGEASKFMDLHCRIRDGLRLYGRRYSARRPGKTGRAVLCLPGLTPPQVSIDEYHRRREQDDD